MGACRNKDTNIGRVKCLQICVLIICIPAQGLYAALYCRTVWLCQSVFPHPAILEGSLCRADTFMPGARVARYLDINMEVSEIIPISFQSIRERSSVI